MASVPYNGFAPSVREILVFRKRIRACVLGAVRSASLRGTCDRAIALCRSLGATDVAGVVLAAAGDDSARIARRPVGRKPKRADASAGA